MDMVSEMNKITYTKVYPNDIRMGLIVALSYSLIHISLNSAGLSVGLRYF